jgi:molybdenum cofactor cytidylyltransferase
VKGVSVLILAAGAARRMNQAKMLLSFENTTILESLIEKVKEINPDAICIVTGFFHDAIIEKIKNDQVQFVFNERWEEGMSGSIKKGLAYLVQQNPLMNSILIMVADQPFISSALLHGMVQLQLETKKSIIAASYAGINGTPVLFGRDHFSSLEKLMGDKGARSILHQYPNDLITVEFPMGEIDIDTEDDYYKMLLK